MVLIKKVEPIYNPSKYGPSQIYAAYEYAKKMRTEFC